jgi:hypothetical protein
MFTYVIVTVDNTIQSIKRCVNCYSYSAWMLLPWWLYIQSGLSERYNLYFDVS